MGNGQTTVHVKVGDVTQQVSVTVEGVAAKPTIDYRLQVSPILSKAGCNKGACHASQHGKGGFGLSVVGSDPDKDYASLVRDRVQRRVDLLTPEQSLALLKPTMQTPHGGGRRLERGSVAYDLLVAWLAGGAPGPKGDAPTVTRLEVTPSRRVGQVGMQQQLRAEATYSDGAVRDVTPWAKFDSLDEGMLQVDDHGLVRVTGKGQAPIMIRFEGQAGIAMFSVPYAESIELKDWQNKSFVDELAVAKFRELGIEPSPLCDDATFVRRAFLDCHRFAADDRRDQGIRAIGRAGQTRQADRPAVGLDRRPGPGHLQRPLRRLLDAEMVRPDSQQQQRPGRAGHVVAA